MSSCKVATLILLLTNIILKIQGSSYSIPTPLIEVLHPGSFRISIEDDPNIHIGAVRFRISINEQLQYSRNSHYKEVRHAVHGRWTWEEPNISLKLGDVLYYSIYVSASMGYRTEGRFTVITELPKASSQASTSKPIPVTSKTSPPETTTDSPLSIYQKMFLNCSQSLLSHQSQVKSLRKANQQLTALLEKYPDAKTLTLKGRIPPDGEAVLTASFLIRERLGLNPDIVSAVRKSENSIEFQVATLAEKLEILEREPNQIQPPSYQIQPQPENCKICSDGKAQPIPTVPPSPSPGSNQDRGLNKCEQSLLNTTQHLLGLQSQLEDIRRSNLQLTHALEQFPESKILTLTANIPRTNDPAMTVRFIIREKLNLNPDIVSAVYISDDNIQFKVASAVEKVEILMIAKEKLVDSKFNIS